MTRHDQIQIEGTFKLQRISKAKEEASTHSPANASNATNLGIEKQIAAPQWTTMEEGRQGHSLRLVEEEVYLLSITREMQHTIPPRYHGWPSSHHLKEGLEKWTQIL